MNRTDNDRYASRAALAATAVYTFIVFTIAVVAHDSFASVLVVAGVALAFLATLYRIDSKWPRP